MRLRIPLWAALVCAASGAPRATAPRFYDDDPIQRVPETADASRAQPSKIELFYEYSYNLFVTSRYMPSNTKAGNVNTLDEVPDSSWLTNRLGTIQLTPAQIARGPVAGPPPAPEKWTVLREKTAGTNPGFTARDANGETWFLEFDSPDNPEGGTGAVEVATKIFWALGYNQIETFVTTFDLSRAEIDPKATLRRPSGARTPATRDDLMELLQHTARNADGTYRVSAGRLLGGKILGPFRYSGTRPDDPNDLVPHEHRRELRALRVFGAWTNLVDLKAGNTLDALVAHDGRSTVRHYLQDVGSTFGMANDPHEWDMGWEYFYDPGASRRRFLSFGFDLSPWQTVKYSEYTSIGLFEGERFDPTTWRPQTPTTPYMELRPDDAFWAARRVAAFSDELVQAAVHTGEFSDSAAERHLAAVVMARRDTIARTYLPAINPIVNPRLDAAGTLTFENAAVAAHVADTPARYLSTWWLFDNARDAVSPLGSAQGTGSSIAAPAALPSQAGAFVAIDISADAPQHPVWSKPVRAYFRRTGSGWTVVGLERLP